jgi:hypothetical protein
MFAWSSKCSETGSLFLKLDFYVTALLANTSTIMFEEILLFQAFSLN